LGDEIERELAELRQIAASIARVGEVSDRARARVMAAGELMATHIGVRFLRSRGLEAAWADARTMLRAEERHSASAKASVLSAVCGCTPAASCRRASTTFRCMSMRPRRRTWKARCSVPRARAAHR